MNNKQLEVLKAGIDKAVDLKLGVSAPGSQVEDFQIIADEMLEFDPYTYFEIAHTRQTGWCVWVCSKCIDVDPNRVVYAKGQGQTINKATGNCIIELMNNSHLLD